MDNISDEENDTQVNGKQSKKKNKNIKKYQSVITRLLSVNPSFTWEISNTGGTSRKFLNGFNLSKRWVLITDPYNPTIRTSGKLIDYF